MVGTIASGAGKATTTPPLPAATRFIQGLPVYTVLLFVFLLGCHEMDGTATDIWWHLRGGQVILEQQSLPTTDWFTYGTPDARWVDLNWLWQIAAVGIWRWGQVPALIIWTSLMGTATFAVLLWRGNRVPVSPSTAALLALVPIMLFAARYPVRPESCAFLLLSASLCVCRLGSRRPKLLWLLPLIQILWVNVHGSFLLQTLVVACFTVEASMPAAAQPRQVRPPWRAWMLVLVMCCAACLVNPYGIKAFALAWTLQSRLGYSETAEFYKRLATEFIGYGEIVQAHGFAGLDLFGILLVVETLLVLGSFAWFYWKRRRIPIAQLLLAILFTNLGWESTKNIPFFTIAALAITIWNVADCAQASPESSLATRNVLPALSTSLILLLAALVPTNVYYDLTHTGVLRYRRRFGFQEVAGLSPHVEARFLARADMPKRVFAFDHQMASACIFHIGPERRVFVDGRLEVSSRINYARLFQIAGLFPTHDPTMDKMLLADVPPDATGNREMPALLLDVHRYLGDIERVISHPRWRPVYYGDTAMVFVYEADAEQRGIPAVDRDQMRIDLLRMAGEDRPDFVLTQED